jgi:hypothetical protein
LVLGCLFLCFAVYVAIGVLFGFSNIAMNMRGMQCVPGDGCYSDPRILEAIILGLFSPFFLGGKLFGHYLN